MDFDFSEEQQMLKDGAQRYMREKYGFESRRTIASGTQGWSPGHWLAYAQLGWLALGLPETAGGLGCPFADTCILMEAFGSALALEPYISTVVIGGRILELSVMAGAPHGRLNSVLRDIAAGGATLALAHEEPGIGHQRRTVQTTASGGASGYTINGVKTMVFDAPAADYAVVSAGLGGSDIALFLIDLRHPLVRLEAYKLIDGTRAGDLVFDNFPLEPSALLVRGPAASAALEDALDRATLAQAAETVGAIGEVLRLTGNHLKTRVQFGQPLGKFQALQHRMAEMFTHAQSARSILYHGLANIDAPPMPRAAAVSAAKVAAAAAGEFVGGQGIQLHGGMGITEEYPVGHYFKRMTALEKAYGDSDWHLRRFAGLRAAHF